MMINLFGVAKITTVGVVKLATLAGFITGMVMVGVPLQDPWFDAFAGFYVFSAITSGMPEPDPKTSSFGYVWLYRSCHILSANGTAYFIAKNKWEEISGK